MTFNNNLFWLILCFILFTNSCQTKKKRDQRIDAKEVIVIGGGLMGSAAAYYIAKEGNRIVLLEKQDSIYDSGSSQGEARIARSSNRGNDIWSYMHNTSVEEIKGLIQFLKGQYPHRQFEMSDIYTTNPVTYVGRMPIYDKLLASLVRQKVDYKIAINPSEGKLLFDVNLPDGVLLQREYNEHSGTINPRVLIQYLHLAIKSMGGVIKYNHHVDSLVFKGGNFRYRVSDNYQNKTTLDADRIIAAAGPYNGSLLKSVAPYFEELINAQRVFLAFYKIEKEAYRNLSKKDLEKLKDAYPVINSSKGTRDGSFFSMIEYYDAEGVPVIKIGGHFQRSDIENIDAVWKKDLSEKEKDWAFQSTIGYFNLLDLPIEEDNLIFDHGYSCVYSLTENEVPLVTPIIGKNGQKDDRFVVLGGMSGVGAKGAMAYGMMASDIMLQKERQDTMYQHVKNILGFDRIKELGQH